MRPSFEALPAWLGRLPEVPPTPVRAYAPPDEGLLRRSLANPRLPLRVAILAIALGVAAAAAAGSVRVQQTAESRAEMSGFATRKAAELSAFGTLRGASARAFESPLGHGGSLTEDVPGYWDMVEGTDGRRFRRRWEIHGAPGGQTRVAVRLIPLTRQGGGAPLDFTTLLTRR